MSDTWLSLKQYGNLFESNRSRKLRGRSVLIASITSSITIIVEQEAKKSSLLPTLLIF